MRPVKNLKRVKYKYYYAEEYPNGDWACEIYFHSLSEMKKYFRKRPFWAKWVIYIRERNGNDSREIYSWRMDKLEIDKFKLNDLVWGK